jgi:hypothetical protein
MLSVPFATIIRAVKSKPLSSAIDYRCISKNQKMTLGLTQLQAITSWRYVGTLTAVSTNVTRWHLMEVVRVKQLTYRKCYRYQASSHSTWRAEGTFWLEICGPNSFTCRPGIRLYSIEESRKQEWKTRRANPGPPKQWPDENWQIRIASWYQITRVGFHSFHHKICKNKKCRQSDMQCACESTFSFATATTYRSVKQMKIVDRF